MLHIHFGTGRLGLGLVAPFIQNANSELYLLNRANSAVKPTGSTALDPARRNELLQINASKRYFIDTPGRTESTDGTAAPRKQVCYHGFFGFDEENLEGAIEQILAQSREKANGVVVTASVLTITNYQPVVRALNVICRAKESESDAIGEVYLIACENTVSAYEVLQHEDLAEGIEEQTRRHVRCVHALVDRVCVEIEECTFEGDASVLVRAEEYGSLKLELCSHTEGLPELLKGSKVEFSRHLSAEKDIKSWLLNGCQWLIALTAFQETGGDADVKLNDFITGTQNHELYATEVLTEMRQGIEALLRSEPQYQGFVKDMDVSAYLDGAAASILARFKANDDALTRILARFRTPTPDAVGTVQSFIDRFLHRIEEPMVAYEAEKGVPPKSATQGVFNLFRLQASGTYVDTGHGHHQNATAA